MVKSENQPRADRDDDERWFGGRRWTGYAAVGFVVVIAVCAGILLLVRHSTTSAAGQATIQSAVASPLVTAAPDPTSAAGVPPPGTVAQSAPTDTPATSAAVATPTVPTAAPVGTVWQLVAGQAIPSQPGVGPAHVDGYTATGYAHSPLGALYAAANDFYRVPIAVSAQTDWRTPLAAMVAPGPGAQVLASLREPMEPEPIGADGMGMNQVAGFKYVSYTDTDAVLQLVLKDKNSGLHVSTVPMKWLNADWRLVMTSDGTIGGADSVVNSLEGFSAWQGAS